MVTHFGVQSHVQRKIGNGLVMCKHLVNIVPENWSLETGDI